ncbi:4997_t:CDS:2, partial [Racocetra persica]
AKFLWIKNLPSYFKLAKTDKIDLFEGLSEQFFEQFFHDSLDRNLLVIRKFKTMNEKGSINIPENAFKIDKYTSVETGNVKLSISINDDGTYFENKDLSEEINFPSEDVNIRQRYRLTGVFFCDGTHHIEIFALKMLKT